MLGFTAEEKRKYKAVLEEGGEKADPYGWILPGKKGHIYCAGEDLLGVATATRGPICRKIASDNRFTIVNDGEDGVNAVFGRQHLAAAARLIGCRRRRVLSEEHKAKLKAASSGNLIHLKKSQSGGSGAHTEIARRAQTG